MDDAQDVEATLRGVSDEFFLALEAVILLERRKRATAPAEEAFVPLSREVRAAVAEALRIAIDQERLAEVVSASPVQAELSPIEAISPAKALATILDEWRAVERRLSMVPAESPEAAALADRFDELRQRYSAALARVRSDDAVVGR